MKYTKKIPKGREAKERDKQSQTEKEREAYRREQEYGMRKKEGQKMDGRKGTK